MKQKTTTWTDGKGKQIPTYAINPVLKLEEKHSHKIAKAGLLAEKYLTRVVNLAAEAYKEVYQAKVADAKMKGNKTGFANMSLTSFDAKIEIRITKPETLYFDNTYTELVKKKFNEYFDNLNAGNETAMFLKELVNDLLYTSGGKLDNGKVLKLRKYRDKINSTPKLKTKATAFVEAVDLFDKAIRTKPGNTGLYITITEPGTGKKRRVALKYTDV